VISTTRYKNFRKGNELILNKAEFLLVNNPLREFIQERYEIPILRKMTPKKSFYDALEIGCGNGNGTHLIKKYFNPAKIEAIDLDERMISIAQKRTSDKVIDFKLMDAAKLEYPDNSFDIIFDFGIIHHIPNWRDCILELARVSKDGGYLLLEEASIESFSGFPGFIWKRIFAHPYQEMFTFREFECYLIETGFKIINEKFSNPLSLLKYISLVARINKN
jgi:ubiquinone/menaquinone biosynthesis C-methylase UbiE